MSVKTAVMFENIRDSADCIQLSSIMGSSLLSNWEAQEGQHVNISQKEPWWMFLLGYWRQRLHWGLSVWPDHACRDDQWRGGPGTQWCPESQPHLQTKLSSLPGQNAGPGPVSEGWAVRGAGQAGQYECNIWLQGESEREPALVFNLQLTIIFRFSLGTTRFSGTRTENFTSKTQSRVTGLSSTTRDWVKGQRRAQLGRSVVATSSSLVWTWWRTVEK